MIALVQPTAIIVSGLVTGAVYGVAAMGLVFNYKVSRVINLAFGAIAMFCAYCFWQLRVQWHLPEPVAVLLAVVAVPAVLALITERVVYRGLSDSSVFARMAASAGILLAIFGVSEYIWLNPLTGGNLNPPSLFPHSIVSLPGVNVNGQQIGVVATVLVVVLLMVAFFRFTRWGLELRAVVTNRGLAELRGVNSLRVSRLAWVISYMLAAVAGLLIAPMSGGDPTLLTLIVVYSLAAAVLGGLLSLPLALVGGLGLGIVSSLVLGYVPTGTLTSYASGVLPFAFLFVALVVRARRFSSMQGGESKTAMLADLGPAATRRRPATGGTLGVAAMAAVAAVILWATNSPYVTVMASGVALALVYLSYRVFTATTGMVSFAQAAFAGIGAFVAANLVSAWGWPWGVAVLAGGVVAALSGAVVAIPTVRLRGVFLALATLAFAQLVDTGVFSSLSFTGGFSGKPLLRPTGFGSDLSYVLLLLGVFVVVAYLCERFQYSVIGRELKAELGSSSGALSIGISPQRGRLLAFMLSAAVAGIAGSLLSSIIQLVTVSTWDLVPTAFLWLATVAIAGVGSTAMMLQLGVFTAVFNQVLTTYFPNILNAWVAIFGVLALLALRVPGGMYAIQASQQRALLRLVRRSPTATPVYADGLRAVD